MNIMKRIMCYSVLIPGLFIFAACSGDSGNQQTLVYGDKGVAQSDKPRVTDPKVPDADLRELVSGNTACALELYRYLRTGNGNVFFSPHSISQAIAMTYAGARAETERQMAGAMSFTLPQERLHPAFNGLDLVLASRANNALARGGKGFALRVANAIWGQEGYPFLKTYLDLLAQNYGAGMRLLDFMRAPDKSRITINDWVSDNTEGKIKDLLGQDTVRSDTRMVLTNTIYFNAGWAVPFNKERTAVGTFRLLDGRTVEAFMMVQQDYFNYTEGEFFQAVEIPYDGHELSMVVLLPKQGRFSDFDQSLTAQRLAAIIGGLKYETVNVSLPKFTITSSSFSLADTLKAMGMTDAFSPEAADFSRIDGGRSLFIGDVIHQSFVKVDEYGTEAAAATAVIMGTTGIPIESKEFNADRPFIFLIRDIKTGAILFMGRLMNPAAQ